MRSPSYQVESEIKVLDFGGFHLKGIKGMHQETGLVNYVLCGNLSNKGDMLVQVCTANRTLTKT